MPDLVHAVLDGRYECRDLLGGGGASSVYRAWDHVDGREVAVKVLLPAAARLERTRARFAREVETMVALDHPNVLPVLHGQMSGEMPYLVMPMARGSLASWVRQRARPLDVAEALPILWQAARALGYAHARGVVHRDVKPPNLLLRDDGGLWLSDFGVARWEGGADAARLTHIGDTLGTLAYMAPEQRLDPRRAGPPSDVYGLGATAYFLTTGRRPLELAMSIVDPAVLLRVPEPLRAWVDQATATGPEDRWPSADAMADALVRAADALPPEALTTDGAIADWATVTDPTTTAPRPPARSPR